MWTFMIALMTFVAVAVGLVVWRGLQFRKLAERGVPVTGTVVRRFQSGKGGGLERTKRITFTYRGPDGRDYTRSASMTRGPWQDYEVGGPIELVVLPEDPGVSAEARLVAAAREALAKKRS